MLREPTYARLLVRLEPGRLVLESRQAGAGSVAVELAVGYEGDLRTAEFNPAYLLQLLRALDAEETVRMELGGPREAAVFAAASGYRHMLMTLRTASPAPEPVFASGNEAVGGVVPERLPSAGLECRDPRDGLGSRRSPAALESASANGPPYSALRPRRAGAGGPELSPATPP